VKSIRPRVVPNAAVFALLASVFLTATPSPAAEPPLIQPVDLLNVLRSASGPKPLILQVGFRVLYLQAHIPGSEYVGPASSPEGLAALRKRVEALPRRTPIVIYCGCCPWNQCPVIHPAYDALRGMGFTSVKALYIPRNFGADWMQKGYPVARGQ
jgi:thiosulfate/3-mercaptopyruvate sulfurtransferase